MIPKPLKPVWNTFLLVRRLGRIGFTVADSGLCFVAKHRVQQTRFQLQKPEEWHISNAADASE